MKKKKKKKKNDLTHSKGCGVRFARLSVQSISDVDGRSVLCSVTFSLAFTRAP
jgi:hypothetical protein